MENDIGAVIICVIMNKFENVLGKALQGLYEDTVSGGSTNPAILNAMEKIKKAVEMSPASKNNDVKAIMGSLGQDATNNPLYSAFEKIKQNPDNPNLSEDERQAFSKAAESMATPTPPPAKKEENKEGNNDQNTSDNSQQTNQTQQGQKQTQQQPTQQPNATTYNPLKQQ